MKIPLLSLGLLTGLSLALPAAAQEKKPQPNKPRPAPKAEAEPKQQTPPEVRAAPAMVKRPWLGVATQPVDPAVRDHLQLARGFGIEIEYVAEGSPAEKAGLRPHDILVRLDEQRLISPEHLAVLVHSLSRGDKVNLALIRKGAEQTLEVTLGETDMPAQPEWPRAFGLQAQPMPGQPGQWQFQGQFPMPNLQGKDGEDWSKTMREYQDRLKEWMEKNQPHRFQPTPPESGKATPPKQPPLPLPVPDPAPAGNKPPAISVRPGFPIQVFGGSGLIRIDNDEGEVTIQVQDGKHSIAIVNRDGETVYQGDYDSDKGADALPKEARDHLKKMKLDDLKVLGLPKAGAAGDAEIKIEIEAPIPPSEKKRGHREEKDGLL